MIGLRRLPNLNQTLRRCCLYNCVCPIYSSSSLGINKFTLNKKHAIRLLYNVEGLKHQLGLVSESINRGLVFMDDIRKMIVIADCDEDLQILFNLLKKLVRQKEGLSFQRFQYDIEIMRLLHSWNKPDKAVELIRDPDLFPNFQHKLALVILLDLLFKNKNYEEIIRISEFYLSRSGLSVFSIDAALIFNGACYKVNTAESLQKALQVQTLFLQNRVTPTLRGYLFLYALAIKQNQPLLSFSLRFSKECDGLTENIRCMVYAQAKRFEDVFFSINNILSSNDVKDFFFTTEAISFIQAEIEKQPDNEDYIIKFKNLKDQLNMRKFIVDKPLDEFLCSTIDLYKNLPQESKKSEVPEVFSQKELRQHHDSTRTEAHLVKL